MLKRSFHKTLIFLHKWLGVTLALLFLMWFISGVVLYYVPFPDLLQAERLAGLPPLQLPEGCCMTAEQASGSAALNVSEIRLGMHEGKAVWRLLGKPVNDALAAPQWRAVDAQSGQILPVLSADAARKVAEAFSGKKSLFAEPLVRDQWTVAQGLDPYRPLMRVEMDGQDGLELYVSPSAAEVVRDTRRAERFWNWVGAVPHWIYFTQLRRYPNAWHNVVVWLSIPGVILCVTGVVLGVWHLFLNQARWIPYRRFWMRWHHIAGLAAAIFTLTWIFSGLLSMNPFGVFSPRGALAAERLQWSGPTVTATLSPAQALISVAGLENLPGLEIREIDLLHVAGQSWYRLRSQSSQALVRADMPAGTTPAPPLANLPDDTVQASLRRLRFDTATAGQPALTRLTAYDDLYYAREVNANTRYTRPLPVWRAQWTDGSIIYADPASARLLLRADASNRWQRVLYNGLHSFDFAPLLARPLLRSVLVVGLSLLGTALCLTSCVIAWRVLVPRRQRAALLHALGTLRQSRRPRRVGVGMPRLRL